MISNKLRGYLGFSAKARQLSAGYNTCLTLIRKRRVKLLIVAEDAAENTIDKMTQKCRSAGVPLRVFGKKDELSGVTGRSGNSIFAVTDENWGRVIREEIDRQRSEGEVF
ncbi:MAG: ribosomal L7Ae/L30e/S12e/Gadd45 family protein [Eubacterium sp.]|nr:ribosomal L7Ae/L30e/S12e/Gadd45 family protein [Eubacterium sp.]